MLSLKPVDNDEYLSKNEKYPLRRTEWSSILRRGLLYASK